MHCPNCGVKTTEGQKFCRACGFNVEKFAHLFVEETARAAQLPEENASPADARLRKLERLGEIALYCLGSVLGALLLWAIIFKMMIEKGEVFAGAIVLTIIAFIAVFSFLGYLGYLGEQRKKAALRSATKPLTWPSSEETAKISSEPQAENLVSITEHTTARLQEKVEQPR